MQHENGDCYAVVSSFYWHLERFRGHYAVCYMSGNLSNRDGPVSRPHKIAEAHIASEGKTIA